MNKFLTLVVGSLLATSVMSGNKARDIMEKVDARDDGASMISTMQMTLVDKKGKKRVRQLRTFAKDIGANAEYKIIFFLSPSDVKNTAFLIYDYSGDDICQH